MTNDPNDCERDSYDLLKADPEFVDLSKLRILATDDWTGEKELHVRMIQMLLKDSERSLSLIDEAVDSDVRDLEKAVHYFKGSADVIRADRLSTACKLVLKFIRGGRITEAKVRLPQIRERFRELKEELERTPYID